MPPANPKELRFSPTILSAWLHPTPRHLHGWLELFHVRSEPSGSDTLDLKERRARVCTAVTLPAASDTAWKGYKDRRKHNKIEVFMI
jgi:hypothetical protein